MGFSDSLTWIRLQTTGLPSSPGSSLKILISSFSCSGFYQVADGSGGVDIAKSRSKTDWLMGVKRRFVGKQKIEVSGHSSAGVLASPRICRGQWTHPIQIKMI
jgi:hypothetical protein